MPNPYEPAGGARRQTAASEVRSPLEDFTVRLVKLGATPDEVQSVADNWDDLDPDDDTDPEAWTRARRDAMAALPDDELRSMIEASREEYEVSTTTEEEAEARAKQRRLAAARDEAVGRIGGNVESVLAWVADDPQRATAVLELETADSGAGRKTLIGPLRDLLDGQEATTQPTAAPPGRQEPARDQAPGSGFEGTTGPVG